MEFKKKMQQRRIIAISYMILGLVLVMTDLVKEETGYFFSFGLALILMGILRLLKHRKITRDDQTMRKQELAESDERTRMIAERARSWAFSLSVTCSGIVVIVLSLMGQHNEALPFAWYVCGMAVLYWISFFMIRKKY